MKIWITSLLLLVALGVGAPLRSVVAETTSTPVPLDDETRVRWMTHIIKGLVELATEGDSPYEHYRYCVAGFTAHSNLDVSQATSRVAQTADKARPWLTPMFVAEPDYRPYASQDDCRGGQFLFGDIDGDVLTMLNTHRRKQRGAIPDWPYALRVAQINAYSEGPIYGLPDYVYQSGANQMFAQEHKLSNDVVAYHEILGECPKGANQIVFYFRFGTKRTKSGGPYRDYSGQWSGGYRMACLTIEDKTLHIDLTGRLYNHADLY